MNHTTDPTEAIVRAKCISLTTFKRDGTPVASPIWFNIIDGKVLLTTPATSWKVKRIRNNARVEFATCTQRGRVTGPVFIGSARLLSDAELAPVLKAKRRRYFSARFTSSCRAPATRSASRSSGWVVDEVRHRR